MSMIKEAAIGFSLGVVLVISYLFGFGVSSARPRAQTVEAPSCDQSLWQHVYHRPRLVVQQACVTVTGAWQDASHGRTADGCRHEKDGDGHCWLRLDDNNVASMRFKYLNDKNMNEQNGNLVVEPICVYRTTQPDAKPACANWHQQISWPKLGAHVRVTGAWVLDTQHGHMEIHPVTRIETIP